MGRIVSPKRKRISTRQRETAAAAAEATVGRKKRRYIPRGILFFNRVIYDRATIYRVTMPTDDCSVFTVAEKKNTHTSRKKTSRIFFCSYRSPHIFLYATTTMFKIFFFITLFVKSASLPLRFDFFLAKKKKGKHWRHERKRGSRVGQWFPVQRQTMLLIFMGFSG